MTRKEIVDEVAEIERTLDGTILNHPDLIAAANARLDYLRNQAISLGMGTTRINELKLKLQAKLATGGDDVLDVPEGTSVIPLDQIAPDKLAHILGEPEMHDAPDAPPKEEPKPRPTDAERKQSIRDLFGS